MDDTFETDKVHLYTALTELLAESEKVPNKTPWLILAIEKARMAIGVNPYAPTE